MATVQDITQLGMEPILTWNLRNGMPDFTINEGCGPRFNSPRHLYAFVFRSPIEDEGIVGYVGKTSKSLQSRFAGYKNPGNGQATNFRINRWVKFYLEKNYEVLTYSLSDLPQLKWGDFNLDVAAGLEDDIILRWSPEWNKDKSLPNQERQEDYSPDLSEEVEFDNSNPSFIWKLGKTYFEKGYLNIPTYYSDLIGDEGRVLIMRFRSSPDTSYQSIINRSAVKNGTPRLRFKDALPFIHQHYILDSQLSVEIVGPYELLII